MHPGNHLVEDAAQRPYVSLGVVWLALQNFGTAVIYGPIEFVREVARRKNLTDSEVRQLYHLVSSSNKQVLRLEISVHNPVLMNEFQGEADLQEKLPYFLLAQVSRIDAEYARWPLREGIGSLLFAFIKINHGKILVVNQGETVTHSL